MDYLSGLFCRPGSVLNHIKIRRPNEGPFFGKEQNVQSKSCVLLLKIFLSVCASASKLGAAISNLNILNYTSDIPCLLLAFSYFYVCN